jgi:hypothetical protein
MLYREIIAVCSEIHIKLINTLCGQNVELLNVNLSLHEVSTMLTVANTAVTLPTLARSPSRQCATMYFHVPLTPLHTTTLT